MEINFPKLEEKILKFWKENRVFEKSIEQRKRAPDFVFYEGPPTVNAKAGLHHLLARVYKDIICRYKTMQGFRVERKAGWDTHGLPVEIEIEKKLGLKSKKEIEKYGIAKFNKKCKESVWEYKQDWEKLTERIGFWLDMENPYITYENDYIETIWWILKQIYKKGLIYQDYKVVPYCPRCQTSLSSHEVALGYKKVKEPAIYVRFKIKNLKFKNTYLLVWTTTPWTLPGNVALAVNPNINYVEAYLDSNESYILAKDRLDYLKNKFNIKNIDIKRKIKGQDLVGLEYEQLINFSKPDKLAFRVVAGDFVSTEEGTGIVHIAPAFGEDDMEVARKNDLPILMTVDESGKFRPEVKAWAKMDVKKADPLIIQSLHGSSLWATELYEHDYPFCWRCDSPLLYYAKESWFINMQKVKKDLIKNNQKINWIPFHLKEGRFGEWLKELKDWAFSRERYWGTPLPIWRCQIGKNQKSKIKNQKYCDNMIVIGSKEDLLNQKFTTNKYYILRHGQTIYQTKKKKIMYPPFKKDSILLTKAGEKQAREAVRVLRNKKIDLIYSSDTPRTRQTAEIVAKGLEVYSHTRREQAASSGKINEVSPRYGAGVKIIFEKGLRDVNLGIYSGSKKEDFYKKFPRRVERFYDGKPAKGESWGKCRKRIVDCLYKIDRKHQGKTILIVSHGDPLWLLEGTMKGWTDLELIEKKLNKETIHTGELRKIELKKVPLDREGRVDFHRPYIDRVEFHCPKCKEKMKRVPEVVDCWFDSGAMPFAQGHWPFAPVQISKKLVAGKQNKKLQPPKQFPADYISEAVDQTRGWFYTLLAISTLLGLESPYKNVISLGHVLDKKGEKMSKSKGNVVDPWQIVEKYGADAVRWYFYTVNQPGDEKLFREKEIDQSLKKFILTLWNCYVFYNTYTNTGRYQRRTTQKFLHPSARCPRESAFLLDKWIISRLNELVQLATEKLDKYDITGTVRPIENFVINDLSQWYVRRSRRRFKLAKTERELKEASETLNYVLITLSKLTAPFIPFLSEKVYNGLNRGIKPSVHLEDWPKAEKKLINRELNKKMEKIREIVTMSLAERARAGIKVRQPIASLKIKNFTPLDMKLSNGARKSKIKNNKELLELIKDEINVKKIIFDNTISKEIEIDTVITSELREEGMVREVLRYVQEMRKAARFKPKDRISVRYSGGEEIDKILSKAKDFILEETKAEDFMPGRRPRRVYDLEKEIKINQHNLWLGIKKI